jgi:hypothetical protein
MNGPLSKPDPVESPPFVTYALKNVRVQVGHGATAPHYGEVSAVIKQDCEESRAQVYSEYVGSKLAALLGVQAAAGVFVAHSRGLRYASLVIAEVGFSLSDIDYTQAEEVAQRYPVEAAKIAVFDIWIGNFDRAGNLRANLGESTDNLIVGLDHGACLLSGGDDLDAALNRLLDPTWPPNHIFGGLVKNCFVQSMVERVQRLSDEAIQEACMLGGTVGSVMPTDQAMLAEVLIRRRQWLPEMVTNMLLKRIE